MRALRRASMWFTWGLFGAAALAGVALSGALLLAVAPGSRGWVASWVVGAIDEAIAGSLELDAIEVLPNGGVLVRGLRVFDPHGRRVISVGEARVFLDVTRLRARRIGLKVDLEAPEVDLVREADGSLSLSQAFAPAHPAPGKRGEPEPATAGRPGWTIELTSLVLRGGAVHLPAEGGRRYDASGLDLEARGAWGNGGYVDARLRGQLDAPVEAPIEVDVYLALEGERLSVPLLSVKAGASAMELAGEADLARRSGRAAVSRLGVDPAQLAAVVPAAEVGDLTATAYVESDGQVATAAAHVEPRARSDGGPGVRPPGGRAPEPRPRSEAGRADAAVAARLQPGTTAFGFDVVADRLDPERVLPFAPKGRITLTARGAATGTGLKDATGRVAVALSPSRLRGGELGPAQLSATARNGYVVIPRLSAAAPGGAISGAGRWREGGPVEGRITLDAPDLRRLGQNLAALLGAEVLPLGGSARLEVSLSGTSEEPAAHATLEAASLRTGEVALSGVRAAADIEGPLRAAEVKLDAAADRLVAGGTTARTVRLRATVQGDEATAALSASVPEMGKDPVALQGRGRFGPGRRSLVVSELSFSYPGTRYALERPATIAFAGPSVDRLELAAGAQRIGVEGGLEREAVAARGWVERLELSRLPRGLLPTELGLRGELTVDVRASGSSRSPSLAGSVAILGGAVRGLDGVRAQGDYRYDAGRARIAADLALSRAAGGSLRVDADLPVSLLTSPSPASAGERVGVRGREIARARASERLRATVHGEGLPLDALAAATGTFLPVKGLLGFDASIGGTAGEPSVRAAAQVKDGAWEELDALDLRITLEDAGERARATLDAARGGSTLVEAEGEVPLDLAEWVSNPAEAARAIRRAPLRASAQVPGLELDGVAGRAGLPEKMVGVLRAAVELEGSATAPRGRASVSLEGAKLAGYDGIAGRVEVLLHEDRVEASGRASLHGEEVLGVTASLGAAPERLATRDGLSHAPLHGEAVVPKTALGRAAVPNLPLSGTVEARLALGGTPASPTAQLEASGEGVALRGRPLGTFVARGRYADRRAAAEVSLAAASGGRLSSALSVGADLGLGARQVAIARAPATLRIAAEKLDLGFLPALVPGVVRAAGGTLDADLTAEGPLESLRPKGMIRLANGRLAVSEYGDWTGIAVEAAMTEDAIKVSRLEVHRGHGRLDARAELRGLTLASAQLDAHASTSALPIMRAGQDLATLDLQVDATGTLRGRRLDATVTVPRGTVRLPKRVPRTLQSVDSRGDIVVGRRPEHERRKPSGAAGAPEPKAPDEARQLEVRIRFVIPGRFLVKSDSPRTNLDLKGDVVLELAGGEPYAKGSVEVIRGSVEPIGGRNFEIERGRVQFTGGPPGAAMLDVQAKYVSPSATVHVTVSGPATAPELKLSSEPSMDDATIALLIATGRTDFKPGSGGVAKGEEAGNAALAAIASKAFKDLVSDKLPVDSFTADASAIRAGKYIRDKVYVGYVRNFEAKPEQGQNQNELRFEYQITPRWMFQVRAGDAQTGSASLMWQRDY